VDIVKTMTLLIAKAMAPYGPLKITAFPLRPLLDTIVDLNHDGFPDLILADSSGNSSCSKVDDSAQRSLPLTSNAWRSRMLMSGRKSPFLRSENVAYLLRRGFPRCSAQYCI
jgi:hypothetical protein